MRVLICGGREYDDRKFLRSRLQVIHTDTPFSVVITGGAPGADRLGEEWAKSQGIPTIRMEANWTRYGKKAGPLRNQWMIDLAKPDFVVAFPGSRGTQDMIDRAKAAGIPGKRLEQSSLNGQKRGLIVELDGHEAVTLAQ
jgi:predicted Rossmann-fold nucleotide-binding protein